jgi:hypothetical protein
MKVDCFSCTIPLPITPQSGKRAYIEQYKEIKLQQQFPVACYQSATGCRTTIQLCTPNAKGISLA